MSDRQIASGLTLYDRLSMSALILLVVTVAFAAVATSYCRDQKTPTPKWISYTGVLAVIFTVVDFVQWMFAMVWRVP